MSLALTETVADCPGEIVPLTFVLDADDQFDVQSEPENSDAKAPERKLFMSDAEIEDAAESVGATPKADWNAASIALLAAEVVDEK